MNFDTIYNKILENYNINESYLDDIITTLEFRLNKNHYHIRNINGFIQGNCENNKEFIYFESENLIINIRSTLDNLLQLINIVYNLNLNGINVNIKNTIRHPNCTTALKDVFLLHTHPKNEFWNFIYNTRNEIVHEVSIKTQLPIIVDELYSNGEVSYKVCFINSRGNKENLLFFYNQCIKLMDELVDGCLHVISNGLM